MFLVYIDQLIQCLHNTKSGLIIGDEHIPAVLLADDTTIVSPTQADLQRGLDEVHQYACTWRLSYNAQKSSILLFRGGQRMNTDCSFKLHDVILPVKSETIYAGCILNTDKPAVRTTRACSKARRTIASLRDVGLKAGGLSPMCCVKIWRRVILPSAIYNCELWQNMQTSEFNELDLLQRYYSRIIQNFHIRSPKLVTTQTLGLWSMEATIDKCKLMYLGRLCRNMNSVIKYIFFIRIGQYLCQRIMKSSVIHDLLAIAKKYGVFDIIDTYFIDPEGYFPSKTIWGRIVCSAINESENRQWNDSIATRPDLTRFHSIHERLLPHRLWNLCEMYGTDIKPMYALVKLGILPITQGQCLHCDVICSDIVKHQVLYCSSLIIQRNMLFETLCDSLCLSQYMKFEDCEDDEVLLVTILGGITNIVDNMCLDTWAKTMLISARAITSWKLQSILYI
jgi:hypothetical protein